MARGDRRKEIFRDDRDRWKFLAYLAEGAERHPVKVYRKRVLISSGVLLRDGD